MDTVTMHCEDAVIRVNTGGCRRRKKEAPVLIVMGGGEGGEE